LTQESDKLSAILGIARIHALQLNAQYLTGVFYKDIPCCLSWKVHSQSQRQRPQYRAPSWPWASVNSPVHTSIRSGSDEKNPGVFDVLRAQIDLEPHEARYGRVCGGFLQVRGFFKSLIWTSSTEFNGEGPILGLSESVVGRLNASEDATLPLFQGNSIHVFLLDCLQGIFNSRIYRRCSIQTYRSPGNYVSRYKSCCRRQKNVYKR
jgi:hypothetical protein